MIPQTIFCFVPILLTTGFVASQERRVLDDLNDVEYVGCFSTKYAQDMDLGKTIKPYSWKSCVLLCQTRGARYAGLMKRTRTCYCGSYLVENSKLFLPSHCPYSCRDFRKRSCGGETTMTVYQLKEDTLPRVLVTSPKMISYVKKNQLIPLITIANGNIYPKIHSHYKRDEIYFNLDSAIVKSHYSTTTNSYSNPPTIVVSSGANLPFVLDWVTDKVFYVSGSDIWEATLNGTNKRVLVKISNCHVYRMELNPYEQQLMYRPDRGTELRVYSLTKKTETTISLGSSFSFESYAIDVHTQSIYGIRKDNTIMRRSQTDGSFHPAFNAAAQGVVTYMAVLDDSSFFFTRQYGSTLYVMYKHGLVNVGLPSKDTRGCLAIHEVIQAPPKKVVCGKMSCSNKCQYTPQSLPRCVCPSDMQLDSTGRQCRHIRNSRSRYSREESDCDNYDDCSSRSYDSGDYSESREEDSEEYSESKEKYDSYED